MKNKLQGKVAVITGASKGIGQAIAKYFHKNGIIVYDISRTAIPQAEVKECFACDVNDSAKIEEILNKIYTQEKHIDIFVNNAGFGIAGTVEEAKRDSIYSLVETNLSAVITLSGMAIMYLKASGGGNIINISSVGAVIPLPIQAVYSATKAGVEIFSKALANEVKNYNIKVTTILPGDTKTSFTSSRIIENEKGSEVVAKTIKKVEKDEQTGKSPDSVGKIAVKILKRKNPPLKKTVGFFYKCVVFLPRILPTKLVNYIVRKLYL